MYEQVLAAFNARPVGNRWKALCPLHEDHHPSLSLWLGHDGRLMLGCWRCHGKITGAAKVAALQELCDAVGVKVEQLFPDWDEKDKSLDRPKPQHVATYVYEDESGAPLHRTLRFEWPDPKHPKKRGKRFAQDRFEDGRWVSGLGEYPKCRRVLYRLPRLLASPGAVVWIAEGEGKVDLLRSWGLTATCCVGGCGMGWIDDYSTVLVGRDVVVLPDNDNPGRRNADSIAGNLMRHRVKSLRILELPKLPHGGDVLDWAATGGNHELLLMLAKATPSWRRA